MAEGLPEEFNPPVSEEDLKLTEAAAGEPEPKAEEEALEKAAAVRKGGQMAFVIASLGILVMCVIFVVVMVLAAR